MADPENVEQPVTEGKSEAAAGGKGKKAKKTKPPKSAKRPRNKEKGARGKRPLKSNNGEGDTQNGAESKGNAKKVVAIVIIGLIAAVGAMYYFNVFQLKTRVVNFFISQDSQYQAAVQAKADYETKRDELIERQLQLEEKEKQLFEKETQLSEQAVELNQQQRQQQGGNMGGQVSGNVSNSDIVAIFEGMSANAAASILNGTIDNAWIAELLSSMDVDKAAKILAKIDVEKAVIVARLMS